MDNEKSHDVKTFIAAEQVKLQYTPPNMHCTNPVECVVGLGPNCIVIVVGSGDDNNHPEIVVAAATPRTTTKPMSWLGSWWGPNNSNNVAAPIVNGSNFWFGLSPL